MAVVSISFCISHFIFENFNKPEDINIRVYTVLIAFIVCFLVCLSRIYLGMHSFLDVFGGIIFSFTFSLIYVKFAHNLDYFLKKSFMNGILSFVFVVLMCIFYPSKKRWSPARADTFLISGAACGLYLGISLKYALNLDDFGVIRSFNRDITSLTILIILRSIIGILIVAIARYLSKEIVYLCVNYYYKLEKTTKRNEIRSIIKSNFMLEIFYYIFCYTNVSFSVIFSTFFAFDLLRLT